MRRCDVLVAIDGNLEHKRRKGGTDPPVWHPMTAFLTKDEVQQAKDEVETKRPPAPRKPGKRKRGRDVDCSDDDDDGDDDHGDDEADYIVQGLRVSEANLDGCKSSYTAAQEKTQASKQIFAETGLMAIICRHDRPLFMAYMESAGERQYYAVALIRKLFRHLPSNVRVGVLYDVGCNLHRSCVKWGLLEEYLHRLSFLVSVLHSYGHQWACQIIYSPRNADGFGLTDGEGCERLWSALMHLIRQGLVSGVRVSILIL